MAESFLAQSAFDEAGLCRLTVDDLEQATSVLSEAFLAYPITNYLFEKKSAKEAGSRNFHKVSLRLGMSYGEVHGSSSKLEGVAIWFPPGEKSLSFSQLLRCGFLSHLTNRGNTLRENVKGLQRIMTLVNHAGEVHARHASVPHWYLMEIGVRDRCRGMGYASRLLKPVLSLCDLKMHPCYLETHDERNLETYNHFGFSVVDESRLPGSDLRHWAMMRAPQESRQRS
jgi:ribosomal protein S18 acetylase RimI-like enzyme